LKKHNDLVRALMDDRKSAITLALEKGIKGTDLERVLTAIEQQKSDSWKINGLSNMMIYPSAAIAMETLLIKNGIIQKALMEGYNLGVSAVTLTVKGN
jgi:hypothetical protein